MWRKMRTTEGRLVERLTAWTEAALGKEAIAAAFDELCLWPEEPIDPPPEAEADVVFPPWLVFDWIPDGSDAVPASSGGNWPAEPMALHFARIQRTEFSSFERRFIEAACAEPYSFFVVEEVEPGRSLTLRDLLLERRVRVHERLASEQLGTHGRGIILFTRVLTMDGDAIMVGCAPTLIPARHLVEFVGLREGIETDVGRLDRELLREFDAEMREIYFDYRERLHHPPMPELYNTDGERIAPTSLHYTLACSPGEAFDALASLAVGEERDDLLCDATFDHEGGLRAVSFSWLKKGNAKHKSWSNTILGHITIEGEKLEIGVNSNERAQAIRRRITRRLGRRAVFGHAVVESLEKQLEEVRETNATRERGASKSEADALMALPEVREKLRQMMEDHWRDWLDSPVPALGDLTPRQAVGDPAGRRRLEALLIGFESPGVADPLLDPDVAKLRQSLGLNAR